MVNKVEQIKVFIEKFMDDDFLLDQIPVISTFLVNEEVANNIYNLCRSTFLTQYNSEVFRNEDNTFSCFISNEAFAELGKQISNFISTINYNNKEILFDEVILILRHYYFETALEEESRSHVVRYDNNNNFGVVSTIYNFNDIDWDFFLRGIKNNM